MAEQMKSKAHVLALYRAAKEVGVDPGLPNPGKRQLCRLPDWWQTTDQTAAATSEQLGEIAHLCESHYLEKRLRFRKSLEVVTCNFC